MFVFSGKYSCFRRLLRAPWSTRISNQRILKEIIPEYSLEGLMMTLKLQRNDVDKASGCDGILVQLFQILKDDAVKVLHSNASKFGKLSSGHRTGKGQFSFPSQRKSMPKNAQTTAQLPSSHTLVK